MRIRFLWPYRILVPLITIICQGCTNSADIYIRINVDKGQEFIVYEKLQSIVPSQFVPQDVDIFIKDKNLQRAAGYLYDANPSERGYYYLAVGARKDTGIVAIIFSEVGRVNLSKNGKELFNKLLMKVNELSLEGKITCGEDKNELNNLESIIF